MPMVKKMLHLYNGLMALLLLVFMTGCSTPFSVSLPGMGIKVGEEKPPPVKKTPPKLTWLDATFSTSSKLNQSASGRASPLKVRIYELKSFRTFKKADFFSLYEDDKGTLGADLLEQDELQFKPNKARRYRRKLQADTRYIGIMAAYRDIDNARWRAILKIKPLETRRIVVHLEAKGIRVKNLEDDGISDDPLGEIDLDKSLDTLDKSYDTYQKYKNLR